jgi:hypothetical protein
MADGVAITAGSGTTILTDDTGAGGHAQVVKLAISTDGSGTLIPAEATNGLDVDPTRHAPVVTGSGSLTASSQAVTLALNGEANVAFQLTGTWTATVTFEASNDGGTNWTSIYAYRAGDNLISQTVVNSTNNDIYRCTTAGFGQVRCRCSAYTSGTIVVTGIASARTSGVFVNSSAPTVTTGTIEVGDMVIAMVAMEAGTTQTLTSDADTTNGTWSAAQYNEIRSSTSGSAIGSQRKVQTTTASTQTFNPTLGLPCDLICSWISVREIAPKKLALAGVG